MARTFPAVIINGILESGKTTFIIDSLKNGDFGDIGKVLIISTEDGEIEFDNSELAKYNAVAHVISSPEEFTVQNINDLIRINKPHAVFFEMNAMWDWEKLQFPPYILIEQTFTIIDGSSFKYYFNNMRQKFTDMVKESDIVIVNRCQNNSEFVNYKRNLKLVNKDAVLLMLDDEQKTISFEEELPYKLGEEMIISDDGYGALYIDTFENEERYNGKIVEFNCMAVLSDRLPPNTFVAGRLAMTCCADDIQLVGHLCASQNPIKLKNKQWIHLRARIHYMREYPNSQPEIILELLRYEEIEEIDEPIVSLV
jgi:hypothetical protein